MPRAMESFRVSDRDNVSGSLQCELKNVSWWGLLPMSVAEVSVTKGRVLTIVVHVLINFMDKLQDSLTNTMPSMCRVHPGIK